MIRVNTPASINTTSFNTLGPTMASSTMASSKFSSAMAPSSAQARFSGRGDTAGGPMHRAASGFLSIHENFMASTVNKMLESKSPMTKRAGGALKVLSNSLLTHDFSKRVPMFNWGKVAVRPPLGALGISFYLGIIPSRLYAATKRPDTDPGEYLDIIIRDVLSISAFVYALEPCRNFVGNILEKRTGLKFMEHGEAMGYGSIDDLYRVTHPNRLLQLVSNPANHKGVRTVLRAMGNNKYLNAFYKEEPQVLKQFDQFKGLMNAMMEDVQRRKLGGQFGKVLNDPALRQMAKDGYGMVNQMESRLQNRFFSQAGDLAKKGVRIRDLYKVPTFKNMFAMAANASRVWIDVAGFAIVIGFLGFGVTKFNEWYTEMRENKRRIAAGNQPLPS
jgi:hypothetical protein